MSYNQSDVNKLTRKKLLELEQGRCPKETQDMLTGNGYKLKNDKINGKNLKKQGIGRRNEVCLEVYKG